MSPLMVLLRKIYDEPDPDIVKVSLSAILLSMMNKAVQPSLPMQIGGSVPVLRRSSFAKSSAAGSDSCVETPIIKSLARMVS